MTEKIVTALIACLAATACDRSPASVSPEPPATATPTSTQLAQPHPEAAAVPIDPAWAAFAGTDDNAVVDGDFAVTEDELQPVLKALVGQGIHVVAIHHHMVGEQPRILFLHYWGRGGATALATSIKGALAHTKTGG